MSTLRSVEMLRVSVVSSIVSFCTNVFLNWVFIFGNLGAPAMGIEGAALATLIARSFEFIIAVTYFLFIDKRLKFKLRYLLGHNALLAGDVVRNGTPVVINELMWSVATSTQAAILGHITYSAGDPVAANSIAGIVQQISTVIMMGVGNAAAIMVGMSIGESDMEKARRRAKAFRNLSFYMGLASCAFILIIKGPFISFYNVPPETKDLANIIMTIFAFVTIFCSVNLGLLMGALRGAGDTKFCMTAEVGCLWCISIPLGLITAFIFGLPVPVVFFCMKTDEIIKTFLVLWRMRGNRWLRSLTR